MQKVNMRTNKSLNGLIESFIELQLDLIHEIGSIELGKCVLDVGLGSLEQLLYLLDHQEFRSGTCVLILVIGLSKPLLLINSFRQHLFLPPNLLPLNQLNMLSKKLFIRQQRNHFIFYLVVEVDVLLFYLEFLGVLGYLLQESGNDLVVVVVFDQL